MVGRSRGGWAELESWRFRAAMVDLILRTV